MRTKLLMFMFLAAAALVGAAVSAYAQGTATQTGETILCKLKVVVAAQPPAKPTGKAVGGCGAFGPVAGSLSATSQFTLIGNPPKAVRGEQTFVGKQGSITGRFQGSTVPVAIRPGTPPDVVGAVAIVKWTAVKATGAYASLQGKSGVSGAYENDSSRPGTLTLSVILP